MKTVYEQKDCLHGNGNNNKNNSNKMPPLETTLWSQKCSTALMRSAIIKKARQDEQQN